jgi:hypothetical protein
MKKVFLCSLLLVLFVSSCSLSAIIPGNKATAPKALQYIFEVPSDPISVTVTLENENKAEALIPVSGGSLNVTGADGTVFRLDIPAGALAADTFIRMIPVSKVDGIPFGTQTYTVQLEPEGQQLYDFGTLTITPPQPLPIDQQIFFGYQGLGENLVLVPPVLDSQDIKLQILHFSGYGVSRGFLADTEPSRARIGGDAESRLSSAVAEQLARMRQSDLLSMENSDRVNWESAFAQFEEQVIRPRIAAAGESCANGRSALQTVLAVERQRQLLGMGAGTVLQDLIISNGLIDTVTNVCLKEEYELCRDDHIVHRIIPVWLGLKRQFDLLGSAAAVVSSAALETAKTYVRQCLTFELKLQSQMNMSDGTGFVASSTVESKVKLQIATVDLNAKLSGNAPLVNTTFELQFPDCNVVANRGGGTFEAVSLVFVTDTRSPTDQLGYVRDLQLSYFPGTTSETATVTCSNAPTMPMPGPWWTMGFINTHQGEMNAASGAFLADNWEILGNQYFARKEWIKDDGKGITEAGTFKLYHIPGQ